MVFVDLRTLKEDLISLGASVQTKNVTKKLSYVVRGKSPKIGNKARQYEIPILTEEMLVALAEKLVADGVRRPAETTTTPQPQPRAASPSPPTMRRRRRSSPAAVVTTPRGAPWPRPSRPRTGENWSTSTPSTPDDPLRSAYVGTTIAFLTVKCPIRDGCQFGQIKRFADEAVRQVLAEFRLHFPLSPTRPPALLEWRRRTTTTTKTSLQSPFLLLFPPRITPSSPPPLPPALPPPPHPPLPPPLTTPHRHDPAHESEF